MKFLFIFLLSVISLISVCGYTDTNAVRLRYTRIMTRFQCTKTERVCSDCSTLMVCSSLRAGPLLKITCTAPNEYCVDGACTSNPGSSCQGFASGQSTFECTDVGIFPDPSDCTRYHVCEQGSVSSFKCDTGFVYNSKLKMCQIGRTPCTKISCSKASDVNTLVPYASDPAYYAFCSKDDKGYSALMFKCPNEDFEEFDVKTKTCQFLCKAKGNFQDPDDCGKYFSCTGKNAKPISAKCPGALVFDGTGCNRDPNKCQYKPYKPQGGNNGDGNNGDGNNGDGNNGGGNNGGGNNGDGNNGGGNNGGGNNGGGNNGDGNNGGGNNGGGNNGDGNNEGGNNEGGNNGAGNNGGENNGGGNNEGGNNGAGNNGGGNNGGDLSDPKPVVDDADVSELIEDLTTEIITKICEFDTDCITEITDVEAKNFRKQTEAGVTLYFVSVVTSKGTYHVKIKYESKTKRELIDVVLKKDTDDIGKF